jgi:hypothetical protein
MSGPTKAELTEDCNTQYDDWIATATKAEIQGLMAYMAEEEGRYTASGSPLSRIEIKDREGYPTVIDLEAKTVTGRAIGRVLENAVTVSGDGPVLHLDLSSATFYGDSVLWFDPMPDAWPIPVTFAPSDPAAEEEPDAEGETAAQAAPQAEPEPGGPVEGGEAPPDEGETAEEP